MTQPVFERDAKPSVVVDATGRWIAERLGFKWVNSRGELRRTAGGLTTRVRLQSSVWSRGGIATWVTPRLMIDDAALAEWRRAHPDETVVNEKIFSASVFNSMTINISDFDSVELSGLAPAAAPSARSLAGFVQWLESVAIPACDLFQSPSALAAGLPDAWLRMADARLVELAISRNDLRAARLLTERIIHQPLRGPNTWSDRTQRFRRGFQEAQDLLGAPECDGFAGLGWLSSIHRLFEVADLTDRAPGSG